MKLLYYSFHLEQEQVYVFTQDLILALITGASERHYLWFSQLTFRSRAEKTLYVLHLLAEGEKKPQEQCGLKETFKFGGHFLSIVGNLDKVIFKSSSDAYLSNHLYLSNDTLTTLIKIRGSELKSESASNLGIFNSQSTAYR